MSRLLFRYLLVTAWFGVIHCGAYQDRPKINTLDGHLILEPGFDKNIYIRPKGPKSTIFVGKVNILQANVVKHDQIQPTVSDGIIGKESTLQRLAILESQRNDNFIVFNNITALRRKVNNLQRRVNNLQAQIFLYTSNNCLSQPCEHGGTCLNVMGGFHCLCPSNWEGKRCDVDVNECRNFAGTDLGCQNGAICINKPGSYECLCRNNWLGLHCTRKTKDCSGGDFEMCGFGTCIQTSTGDGVNCLCNQGWTTNGTGAACLTDVDECDSRLGPRCSVNPKVACINVPGSFRCGDCPPGYEGDGFSCNDIDECITQNGGCSPLVACHNTIGSRICGSCPPGYLGDGTTCSWRGSCNINRGGCHPSAQCLDIGLATQCICPEGMNGDGVGIHGCYVLTRGNDTQTCINHPCGSHGQCYMLKQGYTCICMTGFSGVHCDAPMDYCASNPCQNGGSCRSDSSLMQGFRCECTAQYIGPLCQVHSKKCGSVLDNEEGSIVYPLINSSYSHNSSCAWVIRTVPDKVINATFSKFDIERSPNCLFDFLQIHDGRSSASQLIGRFCGTKFPKGGNIISSHNTLYFWFRSDSTIAKQGFALHWTSTQPVCGGEIDATTHGRISSPGSPGTYPPNRDCYWHLSTSMGKRIQLHFFEFDIESHKNCSFDFLAIYDGAQTTDPLIDKYCNSSQPAPVHSAGSDMLIHFHSDAFASGNGFQISYTAVEGVPGCGGFFTQDRGEITSPSYNGKYLNNLLCEYKIRGGADTKIRIQFNTFKLEKSWSCLYDYLKIYDGPSENFPLVGRFCGHNTPDSFVSSTNQLYLVFKSDYNNPSKGFVLNYDSVCSMTITGDTGIIKSPRYPFSYPENRICEYVIGTDPGKVIELTFQDFDLEVGFDHNRCTHDNLEIRDGPDQNSTLLGRYCGGRHRKPPVLISKHNYMYLRLYSDASLTGAGFYANYTTISTECGGIYKEATGVINYPSEQTLYKKDQTCTWILDAPEGMYIKLTWNRFDIERMSSCESDYLELTEMDGNKIENGLGKYCGVTAPPTLSTMTNRLKIKFKSDNNVQATGFSASYSFLNESFNCEATYVQPHGYIYSPGWPNRYEKNRECTWIITVPVGQQIKLNISEFDLELPIQGSCKFVDYLEIRNGASETSPLVGNFCGRFQTKVLTSLGNSLYIHFYSDHYSEGTGFKIEWDGTIVGCGGTLTSPSGSISSPNYPNDYPENAECFYRIIVNHGSVIQITFVDLELERNHNCQYDYIEIYDGRDSTATSFGRRCSMSVEAPNVLTTSNIAYVKFRSDFALGAKGFLLHYETVCQNNITGRYGIIESPNFPNNYPLGTTCLWTINVPKGNKINITYTHFDIQNPTIVFLRFKSISNCTQDYIQMKETSARAFSEKFCGNKLPQSVTTQSNSFQIKMHTTAIFSASGFRLEWVSYGCGGHLQKAAGRIHMDSNSIAKVEMECEWLIETAEGTSVRLMFTEVFLNSTKNCTSDAIEIYNGQNIQSPRLTRFCQRNSFSVQSTANFMFVRFVKQSSLKDLQFEGHYHSAHSVCGGDIYSHSGFIFSKNYPKDYDNSLDCIWSIHVPLYHRVELNFMDIDLNPYSRDGNECGDCIRIYDGDSLASNYTHRICPNTNDRQFQIISKGNNVLVQFTSDDSGTAKGFKANFSVTCGAIIKALHSGILTNDNLISHLSKNCTWTILAPHLNEKIYLTITHMDIPINRDIITNRTCTSSYLRVYDGDGDDAPLIDEYCGRNAPPMIVSQGYAITIELGTYGDVITGQFSANYSPLEETCGGTFTSEQGAIASPNYPRPYRPNIDCEWILSTSPGNTAYVTFEAFDINYSDGCNEDYLEIRENNGGGKLLRLYCGNQIPTNTTVSSKMYIKFHSADKTNGRGFLLHYGFLHGNEIYGQESGEVASPLYPFMYKGGGEYWWRIVINEAQHITVTIDKLEIPSYGDFCNSKLSIHDGYDKETPLLGEFCGLSSEPKIIVSTSNTIFIILSTVEFNTGAIFHLVWTNSDLDFEENESDKINCGQNYTALVPLGQPKSLQSPKYPEYYDDNLSCEWIFKSEFGRHLSINILDFQLEETQICFADFISVYYAQKPNEWKPIREQICLAESAKSLHSSTDYLVRYLKIKFKTDFSISGRGFKAQVSSECGGILTELSSSFGPTWFDVNAASVHESPLICQWIVKVRPGRQIKLQFQHFNITNSENDCKTYVILRGGDSIEAPLLGNGKYCGYAYENRTEAVTSGNSFFVTFIYDKHKRRHSPDPFQNFIIHYEEKDVNCGGTLTLGADFRSEVINSPNYPFLPVPYSICEWVITGPPGEILRADFIEKFDLDYVDDCDTEAVEIRDGTSRLSPLISRFCGEKPGTVRSTNNMMYVKYVTEISEPKSGFRINISIDICGGTLMKSYGELKSPEYPHLPKLSQNTVCIWRLIGYKGLVFNISPEDIHLPQSDNCTTKVTIEETLPGNNTEVILKTYCSEDILYSSSIQTLSHNVSIKLYIGTLSKMNQVSDFRGFRLKFNSSYLICDGYGTTPEGYISTPKYPLDTQCRLSFYAITVPDVTRRVRLEILDMDFNKQEIHFAQGNSYKSQMVLIGPGQRVLESSGNKLEMYVWQRHPSIRHRFKARFSSNEPALCGGQLHGLTSEIMSPDINGTYTCEWQYTIKSKEEEAAQFISYNYDYSTIYLTLEFLSSVRLTRCKFPGPLLVLSTRVPQQSQSILCSALDTSFRIPSTSLNVQALNTDSNYMYYHIHLSAQPCGGVVEPGEDYMNVINIPNSYNDTLDCIWTIEVPIGSSAVEMKLDGAFELECPDELIQITNRLYTSPPLILFEYCKGKMQELPAVTHFRTIYVEYHSNSKNHTRNNIKLLVKTSSGVCGKQLENNDTVFISPNFPKSYNPNEECVWEIRADVGYRVSLQFIDRFVVELQPNCTSDAVIIYDWVDGEYIEVDKLCGRELPGAYNSTYDRMKVVLRTDNKTNLDGFKARWSQICGGTYIATDKEQILYSPGYPHGYGSNMNCVYNIQLRDERSPGLVITFEDFLLEGTYPDCSFDNLTINTHRYSSDSIYCGNKAPVLSEGLHELTLVLKSDKLVKMKGFKLIYSEYTCGGHITKATDLRSNVMAKYTNNLYCQWTIEAPVDKIVVVMFTFIHLEEAYNCYNDYIAVYEGFERNDHQRLALMCGLVNSTTVIRSNGNKLLLIFITDSSNTHEGFKANIFFSYSTSVGCGGTINITSGGSHILKSPLIGNNVVYENFLDCFWMIRSPPDTQISIKFNSFHISPCSFVFNQTAIGSSKCDCDLVEIKDGINPDSISIGTYCGHSFPPPLISSGNIMGVRLYTDGELASSGFEAELTAEQSVCGQTIYSVTNNVFHFKSPGYNTGTIPKGLNCVYHFMSNSRFDMQRITIKNLDLQSSPKDEHGSKHCVMDKLAITPSITFPNVTLGSNLIVNHNSHMFDAFPYYNSPKFATHYEFCGLMETTDYYITGSVTMILKTSSESTSHKGFELDIVRSGFCGRNYTETHGRIQSNYDVNLNISDCYTLITAPENQTLSLYFLQVISAWDSNAYLNVHDGNDTRAAILKALNNQDDDTNPAFSTGRYVLIHNHVHNNKRYGFGLVYMASSKGRGCGGTLHNIKGVVTSPMYPYQYRRVSTCEWNLETPVGTRLFLYFSVFDLGNICDQNYLQLVDSAGNTVSTFCSETPADYTSQDNYVRIVFVTNQNNGGTGWEANFLAVAPGH